MLRSLLVPAAAVTVALALAAAGNAHAGGGGVTTTGAITPAAKSAADAAAAEADKAAAGEPADAVANAATPAAPAAGDAAKAEPDKADAAAKPEAEPATADADKASDAPKAESETDKADTAAKPETEPSAAATTPDTAKTEADSETSRTPEAASTEATPAQPAADPVVLAVRDWLAGSGRGAGGHADDLAAAVAFYGARTEPPLWVDTSGFTAKAKSALDELRRADDWGLDADVFAIPNFTVSQPSPAALAEGEARLSLELLKYARFAKGGRVNPQSLSRILDLVPPVKDPAVVMGELAAASEPDAYLRDQHPKHSQFQLLRKALVAARGPAKPEIDPALKVRLNGKAVLKVGANAPEIADLRTRLKAPAEGGVEETQFDEKLEEALKAYQSENGMKATGQLGPATRTALNREVDGLRGPDTDVKTQLIVLNMERWRWMPEDLGRVHVLNNIPEFITRTYKDGEEIFKERIIVGLPAWSTPIFSADMKSLVFNPSWGMPDGIKTRELAPRLRAAGGGDFFSALFGGGGGAGASIRAHGLKVYRGGREVDPDSVNWGQADIRSFSFIQPPGPKNPLGVVKFMFPNRHDVYMHDTIEPQLFAQPSRTFSHGCIRVQNPKKFAAVLLAEGNDLDAGGVSRAIAGGGEIQLKNRIPVHTAYLTAFADKDGRVSTFGDVYAHDSRLSAALLGRTVRLEPVVATSSAETAAESASPAAAKQSKKSKKGVSPPDTLADVIGGFWLN